MTEPAANRVTIEAVPAATDEVRALIDELDRHLARSYSAEQRHGLAIDSIFQPHVRFFVARQDGVAAGCAGVALFATFAELKRMYVRESGRGRGTARALLARIEAETIANGRDVLRLETGDRQHSAIRLYERAGFVPCETFGDYASLAPQAIATSIFLEKRLNRSLAT